MSLTLLQIIVIATMLCPIITFSISYPLAYTPGSPFVDQPLMTLSLTLSTTPAFNIGSFLLSLSAFFMSIISYFRFKILEKGKSLKKEEKFPNFYKLNMGTFILGLICTICLHGIASFQYYFQPNTHDIFALLFFVLANFYLAFQNRLDYMILYQHF